MSNSAKEVVVLKQEVESPGLDGPDLKAIEAVLMKGDLTELTIEHRILFYRELCKSLQLNWMTRPFGYIVLNGKLTLYAQKDCTEQLRRIFNVSLAEPLKKEMIGDSYVVTATFQLPSGRRDESTGAVWMKGLQGNEHANALMKAETKAKRRGTLSICGLGFVVDESEAMSIKGAKIVDENYRPEEKKRPQGQVDAPIPIQTFRTTQEQRDILEQAMKSNGYTRKDLRAVCARLPGGKISSLEEYQEVLMEMSQSKQQQAEEGAKMLMEEINYRIRRDKQCQAVL